MMFIGSDMTCYSLLTIKFSEKGQKSCKLYKYGLYKNKCVSKVQALYA